MRSHNPQLANDVEASVSDEVRVCVERNQDLIDCLLARRAQDERRCDLYQRIQQTYESQQRLLETATAALQKELLVTLERLYTLDQQRTRKLNSSRVKPAAHSTIPPTYDAAQQLRASICETQRFNEALRIELAKYASRCDCLRQIAQEKEICCCGLYDAINSGRTRTSTHAGPSRSAVPPVPHTGGADALGAAEDARTCAEALVMDTTQFYQRAFAAARDDVVDYIALQDEFYAHLQRPPSHVAAATSFEVSSMNSVQIFLNTYTQLRRREQERYQELLRTLTRLLREPREE
ncbi:hypothetical protein ABB37_06057 [Leptomonas pyrrhocoris]|uniref:Uncharacterized protein n=1 Tax=Leptomonas pyrrhocoris TaxID=157538 RepID=A0A0N0VEI0_LEPPY|nr:hypothetical protein ABB37_06057 [Leptomonas pyrrhocoris]KPA78428.1 hypothetical protein ABB37_06057 [Leptomonas pyrrhocoris]|eukprot:XP_015656867.1 hypothetical protein ABB37_06057 [Leptomonas pyrrhocoris]